MSSGVCRETLVTDAVSEHMHRLLHMSDWPETTLAEPAKKMTLRGALVMFVVVVFFLVGMLWMASAPNIKVVKEDPVARTMTER